jgi:hypothetical protein
MAVVVPFLVRPGLWWFYMTLLSVLQSFTGFGRRAQLCGLRLVSQHLRLMFHARTCALPVVASVHGCRWFCGALSRATLLACCLTLVLI